MRKIWEGLKKFWDFLAAFGTLVGILYLAQDVNDLPTALQKWRALVIIDRETA